MYGFVVPITAIIYTACCPLPDTRATLVEENRVEWPDLVQENSKAMRKTRPLWPVVHTREGQIG